MKATTERGRVFGASHRLPRRGCRLLAMVACLGGALTAAGCGDGSGLELGQINTLAETGASNPSVAILEGGQEALVAWVGSGGNVYLARLDVAAGAPLGELVRVNDVPGDATPHEQAPAQVASAGDAVYVVWQRKVEAPWLEFGGADLRLARSVDGGRTFAPAVTVNDNDPASPARISFHDIVVAPGGKIHVSWIDARQRDSARELAYAEGRRSGAQAHHRASAGEGDEPGTEVRLATSEDGGRSFSPSIVVDHESCPCCRTAIAVASDGAVYTSWRKIFPGGIRDIAIARSDDGGMSFGGPLAVHADRWEFSACPHAGPSLAVDGEDRLHATWYSGAEGRQGLWYSVSEDRGEGFAEPVPVLTDDWVPPSQARLATGGDRVYVAWDDLREATRRVRLGTIVDGRVQDFGRRLEGKAPSIAAAGNGGVVAWLDGESVRVLTFAGAGQ